ncbi:MAG: NAD-dependent epimerase/dehydratase family protein, partial [Ktedonobacteraceae bacterium]
MLRIAIIGGAGLIGTHLTKAYLDVGHDVMVIDTACAEMPDTIATRARCYQVDARETRLRHILQQERPDIVSYHVAQRTHPDVPCVEHTIPDADVHIRGLLNTLEGCVAASVSKIIFASGGNELFRGLCPANARPLHFKENAPLCPRRPRDISKVAGEWYVRYYTRQYGLTHTILRYADVYGEAVSGSEPHPLNALMQALRHGQRPVVREAVDEVRDCMFIDDVARANLCVLERGHNQTLHIGSGKGHTLRELYTLVADILQCELEPLSLSSPLEEPSSMILDNTLACRVLEWQPEVSFAAGVQRVVEAVVGVQVKEPVLAAVK